MNPLTLAITTSASSLPVPQVIKEIKQLYAEAVTQADVARRTSGLARDLAYLCGFRLVALKARSGHGEFEKLRAAHFPEIAERTATRWMELARNLSNQCAELAGSATLLLTNGMEDEPARADFSRNMQLASDEKSLNQLYQEFGIIPPKREKKKREKKPLRVLTPEEKLKQEQKRVLVLVQSFNEAAHTLTLKKTLGVLASLPRKVLAEVADTCVEVKKVMESIQE